MEIWVLNLQESSAQRQFLFLRKHLSIKQGDSEKSVFSHGIACVN